MNGDTTVALSDILNYVGLAGTVENAVSDAPELFAVSQESGSWLVTAKQAFSTEQKLTVTIGGKDYVIVVTDSSDALKIAGTGIYSSVTNELPGGGSYSYDASTNTLTLNNATITAADDDTYGILAYSALNIVIEGNNNTITGGSGGIYAKGDLTISGTGKLSVSTDTSTGIEVEGALTIKGGTVDSTGSVGIDAETLEIGNNATVTANGNRAAIVSKYDITISSGRVTAILNGDDGWGIISNEGTIKISGGTVMASAANGCGLKAGFIIISGGQVTAVGGTKAIDGTVCNSIAGIGWNDNENEADIEINNADGQLLDYLKVQFPVESTTTYTVTFDSNGGSAVSALTVAAGSEVDMPADPTRDGYTFEGWYTNSELTKPYEVGSKVTADITLYAGWIEASSLDPEPEPVSDENTDAEGTADESINANISAYAKPIFIPESVTTSVASTTPSVRGLDSAAESIADENSGEDIELKLVVEPQGQSKATEMSDTKMRSQVTSCYVDEEAVEVDILDINIEQYIGEAQSLLHNTGNAIEIALGYDFTGKYDPVVIREHDGALQTFTSLSTRPSDSYTDATFYADTANNKLYIYSNKFSEYVVAYSTEEGNARAVSSGGSSSAVSYPRTVTVYRLFNKKTGTHFYTANEEEYKLLLEQYASAGWTDEGIAFRTAVVSNTPVYRLLDANTGSHVYTADAAVRDAYVANGYVDEGLAWYAAGTVGRKVYKITNPSTGDVVYTTSQEEADVLATAGFTCEEAEFVVY